MVNFYSTIFTIEVALLGITIAAILVFVQLVYTSFSHRETHSLFKSSWFWQFIITTSLNIILSAFGSYLLSLTRFNLVPWVNFNSAAILNNQYFGLIPLFLLLYSILTFIFMINDGVKHLDPSSFLSSDGKIPFDKMRGYILKEKEIHDPSFDMFRFKFSESLRPDKKLTDEEIKEKEEKFEKDKAEFERVKAELQNYSSPFEPINEIGCQAIKTLNARTLKEVGETYCRLSQEFIEAIPESTEEWSINEYLERKFVEVLVDNMEELLESCWHQNYYTGVTILIKTIKRIATGIIKDGDSNNASALIDQLKRIADDSIGKSKKVFESCVGVLEEIGKLLIKENDWRMAEEVFVVTGWLGERIIDKVPFEDKPLMRDDSFHDEHDILLNCIYGFRDEIGSQEDPMIYFDACDVIIIALTKKYPENPNTKETISHLAVGISMFGDEAAESGNGLGASRSLFVLDRIHESLINNHYIETAKVVAKLFIDLGIIAAANEENLKSSHYLSKKFSDYVYEKILAFADRGMAEGQIGSAYTDMLKHKVDHDKVYAFMRRLGVGMHTNFGFMFDSITGEPYSEEDPRRR